MVRRCGDGFVAPVFVSWVFEIGEADQRYLCEVGIDHDGYLAGTTSFGVSRLGFQPKEIAHFQALDESGNGWHQAFAAEPEEAILPRLLSQGESAAFRPQVPLPEEEQNRSQTGRAHTPQFYRPVPLR